MIWWLNVISSAIILAVCLWAVLNPRVETRIVGTISRSGLGLFSALNILKPGFAGFFSDHSQTMANVSLATLALWCYVHYREYLRQRGDDE